MAVLHRDREEQLNIQKHTLVLHWKTYFLDIKCHWNFLYITIARGRKCIYIA